MSPATVLSEKPAFGLSQGRNKSGGVARMREFLDEIGTFTPALRRYARALTGDIERADDLVQDTLERAIRKQGLFSPKGSLRSWLFTVMINIYRNNLRSQKRRPHLTPIDELTVEPLNAPEQHVRLALAETKRAIEQLPDEQRQVLLLVALEGFSYKEATAILEIPQGTLMSRLGRARANLRKLTGEGEKSRLRSVK
jgi:RNA polymerase sigma-70 factor, ECF subfamily